MSPSQNNWPFIINVGNSIIGVTVLAMPFCFKTCGIILGALLLFFATWLTIVSCQLLMKAGVSSRRRSYSLLAYFTHGATGKLIVEIGMIGLQLGTLVAQIVIIGDLGPGIVSKAFGIKNSDNLRTGLILFLCLFIGLPLGLLKDVRALSKTSTLCIMFYTFFSFYVVLLSLPKLVAGDWFSKVNFWRLEGFFQCLPIFSFAFGCQTQLFITYDALAEPSLKRINAIVGSAVHMCTVSYLLVGFFGYIAFCDIEDLSGDIINHFEENMMSDALKLCFVFSIAVSIPLIVFPCRMSLYTLCFPNSHRPKEDVPGSWKIPEFHFRVITVVIIVGSMIIGILIPNIEFVLGLNGATTGTLICYIFPALFYLNVMSDKAEGKLSGRLVLACGLTIMIASTYTTLSAQNAVDTSVTGQEVLPVLDERQLEDSKAAIEGIKRDDALIVNKSKASMIDSNAVEERHEPPVPQAPDDDNTKVHNVEETFEGRKAKEKDVKEPIEELAKDKLDSKDEDKILNKDEEKNVEKSNTKDENAADENKDELNAEKVNEMKVIEEKQIEAEKKQDKILEKLEQQQQQQEKIIQEQKEILEQLKEHNDKHKDEEIKLNDQVDQNQAVGIENKNNLLQQNLPNGQVQMAQDNVVNVDKMNLQALDVGQGLNVKQQVQPLGGGLLPPHQDSAHALVGDQLQQKQPEVQQGQQVGEGLLNVQQRVGVNNGVGMQQNLLPLRQDAVQPLLPLKQDSNDGMVLNNNNHVDNEQKQNLVNMNVLNAQDPVQKIGVDSGLKYNVLNNVGDGLAQNNVPVNVKKLPNEETVGIGLKDAQEEEGDEKFIDNVKHRGKRDGDHVVMKNLENINMGVENKELNENAEGNRELNDNIDNLQNHLNNAIQADAGGLVGKERGR